MLINIARVYIDLLVERDIYRAIPRNKHEEDDDQAFDEMRYFRDRSKARIREKAILCSQVEKEIREISPIFKKGLLNASEEELKDLAKELDKDTREYQREFDRTHNPVTGAFLSYYNNFISRVEIKQLEKTIRNNRGIK